jgi:hypothetical protein
MLMWHWLAWAALHRSSPAASSARSTDAAQLTLVLRTRSSNSARVFSVDRAEDKRGLIGLLLCSAAHA